MSYSKVVENGIILAVGKNFAGEQITEEEYNEIITVIRTHPQETETVGYRLKTDLTWEQYEKPPQPEPEPDAEELLSILTGGDAE